MRQAGVSLEHDDRPRPVTGVPQPASNPIAVEVAERYAKALTLSATVPAPAADSAGGVPERRTVTIRGRGAERDLSWSEYHSRRRPAVPAHERPGFQPDRAALWAFFLGLLLVLVAATSAHGAVLMHAVH